MRNRKKLLRSLIAAGIIACVATLPGQAAPAAGDAKPAVKVPIVVDADEIYFNDMNGNMFAKGDVAVTQDITSLYGALVRGNAKQSEIWIDEEGTFVQPGTKLVGLSTNYNYKSRTGTMAQASGMVGHERVFGQNIDILPGEVIIHDGTTTGCPAKVPDYHVSASRVEIWPGDKLIAYNAKFWIKNTIIYTMDKYQKSLRKDAASEFPQTGYYSDDGFFLKQHLEYPLGDKIALYGDLAYYTKAKFKPAFGLIDREDAYTLNLTTGNYRDGDGNWVKKEPELRLDLASRRVGSLPVSYTFYALYGKWTDSAKTSWHQDYNLYFSRDPLKLSNLLTLNLGTGVERIRDSYNGSTQNIFKYDAALYQNWSAKFTTWTAYHYTNNNLHVFTYGQPDLSREFDVGFSYKIDRMNTLSYNQSYDMLNKRVYDQDVTWSRNLHCWEAAITYRIKRHQWKIDFATMRF